MIKIFFFCNDIWIVRLDSVGKHNIYEVNCLCLIHFLEILVVFPLVLWVHIWTRSHIIPCSFCVLGELWGNAAKISLKWNWVYWQLTHRDYVFLHGIGTTTWFWMIDMLKGIKTCIKRLYCHIVNPFFFLLRMRFKFFITLES